MISLANQIIYWSQPVKPLLCLVNHRGYIKTNSLVIYLEVSFEDIMDRIPDFSNRGFVKEADQTMEHAFNERESIYREFADHIVTNNDGVESCFNKILSVI